MSTNLLTVQGWHSLRLLDITLMANGRGSFFFVEGVITRSTADVEGNKVHWLCRDDAAGQRALSTLVASAVTRTVASLISDIAFAEARGRTVYVDVGQKRNKNSVLVDYIRFGSTEGFVFSAITYDREQEPPTAFPTGRNWDGIADDATTEMRAEAVVVLPYTRELDLDEE